jgi:hypothetical protein
MTKEQYKEANRLFWIIKGRLIPEQWDEKAVLSVYNSYFDRVWVNTESYYREDGFEEAWCKKYETT